MPYADRIGCKKLPAVCDGEVKAVRVNKQKTGGERRWHGRTVFNEKLNSMKTLTKLALAAALLNSAVAAQAQIVRGHSRSNGTYVAPYYLLPVAGGDVHLGAAAVVELRSGRDHVVPPFFNRRIPVCGPGAGG